MKKLIALVAVATMLFGLVGTASAYDVAMTIFLNPDQMQRGPSDYGDGGDLSYSFTSASNQFLNVINMSITGKYADAIQWYNYGNSAEQAAWIRIPIVFDSVDGTDFPNINTKSTQWTSGKLIQAGTLVSVNGVMYPVGVLTGRSLDDTDGGTRYYPFARDVDDSDPAAGTKYFYAVYNNKSAVQSNVDSADAFVPTNNTTGDNYVPHITTGRDGATTSDALGIMYPIKLIAGGMTETLNISYTPNGVEVYKATINITYYDTASANNATMAREIGDNAAYFNAKYTGGDTMAFDTVLRSGSMVSKMEKYYYRSTEAEGRLYNDSDKSTDRAKYLDFYTITASSPSLSSTYDKNAYVEFPTIKMEAKVKLLDKSGNALPVRTQVRGTVGGKTYGDGAGLGIGHYTTMTDAIVTALKSADLRATSSTNEYFLFRSSDVYDSTFSAATETDDGNYHELDSNGEFTVTARVIDNSSALYKAYLDAFIAEAIGGVAGMGRNSQYTIKPYFVPLNNVESSIMSWGDTSLLTIEGVKNRVNYKYLGDVKQDVYTYNVYDRQFLKYDMMLNSMDRIEASSFTITGNSSEMLAVGSTRQLQATTGHASAIITDRQVNWKSSNPAVATVNATTGLVTAVADGTTYITAQYAVGTGYDTVAVTVGTPVVATPEITAPTTTQYFVAVGSSSSLNVRSGANTKSARVGRLKRGDTVNVYEIVDGWAKIDYNGSIAYVSSRYISQ